MLGCDTDRRIARRPCLMLGSVNVKPAMAASIFLAASPMISRTGTCGLMDVISA